jgi:cobalt-zinc-cadmium efflux system protein
MHIHTHSHGTGTGTLRSRLILIVGLNALVTVLQLIYAYLSSSLSLLSDAIHNGSDVVSLVISLWAVELARRAHSDQKTFGYKRAEILAAFVNGGLLIGVSLMILKEAVMRLLHPVPVESVEVMVLAGVSVVMNGVCAWLLHQDSAHNLNIRSSYLHLFSDIITSAMVGIGGLGMYWLHWEWLDGGLSILVSIYLLLATWKLMWQAIQILMQFAPGDLEIGVIQKALVKVKGVKDLHHMHLWTLTDHEVHFEAHVRFEQNETLEKVAVTLGAVECMLKEKFKIQHVTLQPEFEICTDTRSCI